MLAVHSTLRICLINLFHFILIYRIINQPGGGSLTMSVVVIENSWWVACDVIVCRPALDGIQARFGWHSFFWSGRVLFYPPNTTILPNVTAPDELSEVMFDHVDDTRDSGNGGDKPAKEEPAKMRNEWHSSQSNNVALYSKANYSSQHHDDMAWLLIN